MSRPTCAAGYPEKPDNTSAIPEDGLLVLQRVPGPPPVGPRDRVVRHRVNRRELSPLRQAALLDHPRQHPLAVRLVAVVELALVLVRVLLRAVMRRVISAGAEPHEPR